jgi:type II restriction enzyme
LVIPSSLETNLARYKSASQRARVFSEDWVQSNFHCPRCANFLERTKNNSSAKDFVCKICDHGFELKSKLGAFGNKVVDGAYQSMLASIRSGKGSHLVLLSYTSEYTVRDVVAVPRHFLIEEIVIPRKPLGQHCRRAGWQGCTLNIGLLPSDGRISCVSNFKPISSDVIGKAWNEAAFLDGFDSKARGWLAVTMGLIRRLNSSRFSLRDLYALEDDAKSAFPQNEHVREKLRQQLQKLRDIGWLRFEGKGHYTVAGGEC